MGEAKYYSDGNAIKLAICYITAEPGKYLLMYVFLVFSDKTVMDTKSKAIKQLQAMINI